MPHRNVDIILPGIRKGGLKNRFSSTQIEHALLSIASRNCGEKNFKKKLKKKISLVTFRRAVDLFIATTGIRHGCNLSLSRTDNKSNLQRASLPLRRLTKKSERWRQPQQPFPSSENSDRCDVHTTVDPTTTFCPGHVTPRGWPFDTSGYSRQSFIRQLDWRVR